MPVDSVHVSQASGGANVLRTLVHNDGSTGHSYIRRLAEQPETLRDRADFTHYLTLLHGRYPGVIDHAQAHAAHPAEFQWFIAAAAGFAEERAFLVRLVAAVGPLPSTPGQAESESAAAAQRHAIDMLSQSDRRGCATGAALTLALDWHMIRGVLDMTALKLGIEPPRTSLPGPTETLAVAGVLSEKPNVERALLFGAQQLLAQHRGLWDLLEARADARSH